MEISAFYILIYTIEGFIFGNYAIRLFDSKFHWHLQVSMLFIFYSGLYLLSRLELSWSCNTVTFFAANFCWLKPERIRAISNALAVLTKYSSINSHPFNKIRQNCWIRQAIKWKKLLNPRKKRLGKSLNILPAFSSAI